MAAAQPIRICLTCSIADPCDLGLSLEETLWNWLPMSAYTTWNSKQSVLLGDLGSRPFISMYNLGFSSLLECLLLIGSVMLATACLWAVF